MILYVSNDSSKCIHEKVYEDKVLLTNPPKIRWTCNKCKVNGYKIIKLNDLVKYR